MTTAGTTTGTRRGRGYWAPHVGREGGTGSLPRGEALYVSVPANAYQAGTDEGSMHYDGPRQPTGAPIRGTVISPDDPRIPDTVYHVTTAYDAVMRSGVLRARGVGGLGGDKHDQIVSLTINEGIAEQLAADLEMAVQFCKEFSDQPRYEWFPEEKVARHFRADGSEFIKPDLIARARRMTDWLRAAAQADKVGGAWDFEPIGDIPDYTPHDWLIQFFTARSSWDYQHEGLYHKRQNPIIFTDWEILAKLDPKQVGIVRIPKANLKAAGALITDFDLGERHLEEIRVYGDVPVKARGTKAGPGRGYWAPHRGRQGGTGSQPRGGTGAAVDLGPFASQAELDAARYGVRSWQDGMSRVEHPSDLNQAIYAQEKYLADHPDSGLTVYGPYDSQTWHKDTIVLTRAQSEYAVAEMKTEYAARIGKLRQELGWPANWRDLIPGVPLDLDPWERDVQFSEAWNTQMDAFHARAMSDMQKIDPSQWGQWELRSHIFEDYNRQAAAELTPEQAKSFEHWTYTMGIEYGQAQEFEVQHMISAGKIAPEDGNLAGIYDTSGWQPLPRELYHVTTNAGAIQADRIRSRWESGQRLGLGLGGGDDNTISLTTSRKMAGVIEQSLHEAHLVASGQVTMQRLVELAQAGYGNGGKSFAGKLAQMFTHGDHDYNDPLWSRPDYDPFRDGMPGHMQNELLSEAGQWHDTPEKIGANRWDFFRNWLRARQAAGGLEDPLFFGTDWQGLAKADPRQFGILTYKPRRGARGKQMSGLAEWRVVGGDVVELTEVGGDVWWDQIYEDMTGKPYQRRA